VLYSDKRLIFAGGTDWSAEFLDLLHKEGFNLAGVLAPPDSKKDRGQKVNIPSLKTEANRLHIPIWQPQKLNDKKFLTEFREANPDVVVAVAYGKIFPKKMLTIPPLGFINFHPSLLPKLRGPSPIQSAILEDHKKTGVSIIRLGEGMDDGPILAQEKAKVDPRETVGTLTHKLVDLGKEILLETLKKYLNARTQNFASSQKQNDNDATYCKIIKKEDGRIDWQKETAGQIDRKVRALNPQIKTFTFIEKNNQKRRVNILESIGTRPGVFLPGQYKLSNVGAIPASTEVCPALSFRRASVGKHELPLQIGTKKGILLIAKLQIEGKKPISAKEFFIGYRGVAFLSRP